MTGFSNGSRVFLGPVFVIEPWVFFAASEVFKQGTSNLLPSSKVFFMEPGDLSYYWFQVSSSRNQILFPGAKILHRGTRSLG